MEHLSEGDISLKDKAILTIEGLQGQDFYSLFLHESKKRNGIGDKREELLSILMSFSISGSSGHSSGTVRFGTDG